MEVSIHIPDWSSSPFSPDAAPSRSVPAPPAGTTSPSGTSARTLFFRTATVKNNGFNPVWDEGLSLPFDCVGDMFDLIFVRFAVKQEDKADGEPLAVYCTSLGSLEHGMNLDLMFLIGVSWIDGLSRLPTSPTSRCAVITVSILYAVCSNCHQERLKLRFRSPCHIPGQYLRTLYTSTVEVTDEALHGVDIGESPGPSLVVNSWYSTKSR